VNSKQGSAAQGAVLAAGCKVATSSSQSAARTEAVLAVVLAGLSAPPAAPG
jgi:hypothetical protein